MYIDRCKVYAISPFSLTQELLALQQETKTLRDQTATLKQQKLETASSKASGGPSLPFSSADPVPFDTNSYNVLLSSSPRGDDIASVTLFTVYVMMQLCFQYVSCPIDKRTQVLE
jgi:hypothetical protein